MRVANEFEKLIAQAEQGYKDVRGTQERPHPTHHVLVD
jgi:hypothetical protein